LVSLLAKCHSTLALPMEAAARSFFGLIVSFSHLEISNLLGNYANNNAGRKDKHHDYGYLMQSFV
jgi:hypothetical protein